MFYVQCELQKGNKLLVTWIPEKFAKLKNIVRVKDENDQWEDGWEVKQTYGKITEQQAFAQRDLYKQHRKGTDI